MGRNKYKRNKWNDEIFRKLNEDTAINNNEFGDVEKNFRLERLSFSEYAFKCLMYYARAAKGEVSGFGRTVKDGKDIFVSEVLLFKQECSSGGTTLNAKALADFVLQLIQTGRDPSEYKLWWHTHNDFGVFWSGTDEATAKELSKKTQIYSVCVNKNGEIIGRVDNQDRKASMPVAFRFIDRKLEQRCIKEVKDKVEDRTFDYKQWQKNSKREREEHYDNWKRRYNKRGSTRDTFKSRQFGNAEEYDKNAYRGSDDNGTHSHNRLLEDKRTASNNTILTEKDAKTRLEQTLFSRGYTKINGVWRYIGRSW